MLSQVMRMVARSMIRLLAKARGREAQSKVKCMHG